MDTPLAQIKQFLQRHRFIFFVLPSSFAVIALLLLLIMPIRYEASGLIEIMPRGSDLSPLNASPITLPTDSMVLTQVEIITSSAVLKQTAENLKQSLPTLQHAVKAEPIGRSYIMRVTAHAADPAMAQNLTNTVMQDYQSYKMALRTKRLQNTADWLRQHLSGLSEDMHQSAEAVNYYQNKEQLIKTRDVPITTQQLGDLNSVIINAKTEQAGIQATDHISSQDKNNQAMSEQVKSPVLVALAQEEALLAMKLAELQQKYGPKHPALQAVQAEMAGLQAKRQHEIKRLGAAIHAEREIVDSKIDKLEKQFQVLKDRNQTENQSAIQLQTLLDEAEADRALYDNLLKHSKEAGLYANLEPTDSQIIAWAEKPLHRSNPNPLLIILLSLCAGFMLALVTALLTEQLTTPYQGRV